MMTAFLRYPGLVKKKKGRQHTQLKKWAGGKSNISIPICMCHRSKITRRVGGGVGGDLFFALSCFVAGFSA